VSAGSDGRSGREIPGGAQFFQRMIAENGGEATYARDSIAGFAGSALKGKYLKGSNRQILDGWRREFIQECNDPEGVWTNAYRAIELAFRIGVFVGSTRTASNAIEGWKRELTAGANEKNRNESDAIQKIIDEEATRHWDNGGQKKPSLTARMIANKVRERITEMSPIPAGWKETLKDEVKLRDAVRKRLPDA
jgi:hypothetical protein